MTSARITYCEFNTMSIKIVYLPRNFIPPQNRFLATLLTRKLHVFNSSWH